LFPAIKEDGPLKAVTAVRLFVFLGTLFLAGCNAPHSEEAARNDDASDAPPPVVETVTLTAAKDAEKLGGIATVLVPDALLQLDADIRTATVAADFSRGQLERFRTSTLLSKQMLANAVRQEGIDASQLKLTQARLRQTWGDEAPFLDVDARQKLMTEIGAGTEAIVRFDFPDLAGGRPRNVRVVPLRGGRETKVETIWPAPSGNMAMPGVSFFGLIPAGPGLRAGDRARLIADNPEGHAGVVIPNAAIVVYASKSWCYIETAAKKYERKLVSLEAPVDDGFLVRSGFEPGDHVVVRGASVLLAREAEPGSLDDDDDGGSEAPPAGVKPGASVAVQPDRTATRSVSD
jgi:hypothetical protein